MKRTPLLFILLVPIILGLFLLDLMWGAVQISTTDVFAALWRADTTQTSDYIILSFRLPKALTSLFAGAGIAITGLQMQSLFRNPLADTSILGISSGAGLGVALYTMSFFLFPNLIPGSGAADARGMVLAAVAGASLVLLLISAIATRVKDTVSILIIGVMIGFLAGSAISILQFFTDREALRSYLIWSFGSVSDVGTGSLYVMIPLVTTGLLLSLLLPKYMNAFYLGENYTHSLGIHVGRVRAAMIVITGLICGTITAFTGPIAFLGIAVPHFTRMLFRTSDNRVLIPATMCLGAALMLVCDIITQVPGQGFVLPINAVTSLIGAPVVIFVLLKNRKMRSVFD